MKTPLVIFCFALLSVLSLNSNAQNVVSEPEGQKYISDRMITTKLQVKNYTGTPYEIKEFKTGNVYNQNNQLLASNVGLRYNVLRDEIEIKPNPTSSNSAARVMIKSPDIYIKIYNKLLVFVPPKEQDRTSGGYFQVLFEGENYDLFKKVRKEFVEGRKAINSISKDVLPAFKDKEALFLVDKDGNMVELPKSKNGRIKAFGEKNKDIKKFVKDNRLNINKEYDLLKVVEHYNTI